MATPEIIWHGLVNIVAVGVVVRSLAVVESQRSGWERRLLFEELSIAMDEANAVRQ